MWARACSRGVIFLSEKHRQATANWNHNLWLCSTLETTHSICLHTVGSLMKLQLKSSRYNKPPSTDVVDNSTYTVAKP